MKLSEKCSKIQGSVTLAIDAKAKAMRAQGENVISFGAGEPDFQTPDYIVQAAIDALKEGRTKYTAASGLPELKQAVANLTKKNLGIPCTAANVVISTGAKQALFNSLQVICNPGDEVIIFAPYWVSYPELVKMADAVPVFVQMSEEKGYAVDFDTLKKAINKNTKAILINTPSNPSGAVLSEKDIREIAQIAEEHDLMLISDEIYDCLVYDGEKHFSPMQISDEIRERTILINGMSKAYSMTGWRMGYSVSNEKTAKMIGSLQSHATGNPNTIAQYATLAAVTRENPEFDKMYREFDRRRKFMVETINNTPGISARMPKGAFYVMLCIKDLLGKSHEGKVINNSMDFAESLLESKKTAVVPGGPFGAEGYIRLSYATSMKSIAEGLKRIAEFVKEVK